ncbi:MAG: tungstate transport system permease protein [Methanothermococcus sp.]|jgi:tungstate transport system permease protein|uniref:ABC transporter permease n=1 Tax=Methanothermococcus TaxID=155862 RepID=UPI000378CDB2|nr:MULTISPECIES: ABC transporter permease [Methanothermococcus]MDK2790405.1 tungstate transport system permease protein [Methanothermococcus sp.]MDK2987484.1 tungstate transport system permease protein [Methanothermococcus sp.]
MFEYLIKGFMDALVLIQDDYVLEIAWRSIKISGSATLLSISWSLPISIFIAFKKFKGRFFIKNFINSFMGIPTVIWGLMLYLLFVPKGPLGFLDLLYFESGISIGQALLITPIVMSIIIDSFESVEKNIKELCLTLGASEIQTTIQIIKEIWGWIILATITGFNRAISELGIALMIGGNIYVSGGYYNTRVLTTAIQMHTVRADISTAIALGIILMSIIIIVNLISNLIRRKWY